MGQIPLSHGLIPGAVMLFSVKPLIQRLLSFSLPAMWKRDQKTTRSAAGYTDQQDNRTPGFRLSKPVIISRPESGPGWL